MSLPGYSAYQDSGVEWLEKVPSHWALSRVSYLFRAGKGRNGQRLTKEFLAANPGDYPVYSGQTQDDGLMGTWSEYEFDFTGAGVLFSTTVGAKAMHLKHLSGKFSLSQNCLIIWPTDRRCNLRFFYYHFQPLFAYERGQIPEYMQASFRIEDLYAYLICVPPEDEQKAIANFLDRETAKIDALVAEQQRLIELLKEKRQAVISHAVTKGLDPNAKMKPSGIAWLGDVPEHWELRCLKHLVTFESGGTPSKERREYWDGDVPWASSKDLKSETISDSIDHVTRQALTEGAASLVASGSVLVVVRGMILCHTFPVVQTSVPMAINQDLKSLTTKGQLIQDYLPWLLRGTSVGTFQQVDEAAHGTKVLRMESWASIVLPVPSVEEQVAIASELRRHLDAIDLLVRDSDEAVRLLAERRAALISAAVTGKIDVRHLANQGTA